MGKKLVQKVVKHTKFSEDDSAMSNGAKLAVGAVVTGFGLAGIYAAATPGGVLDFTGQKPIQKT